MNLAAKQTDLLCLVADKNTRAAVKGIVNRSRSLGIRAVEAVIWTHPEKDPGCYRKAHDFLSAFCNRYQCAIVVFDREGCGNERDSREAIEAEVEGRLAQTGWADRAKTIVIDPELESWVWSDSPQVDVALGWTGRSLSLRCWLAEHGWLEHDQVKPDRPKEAMEAVLRSVRKPRSSAIYQELAENVSLRRCADPAFAKLQTTLQRCFPRDYSHRFEVVLHASDAKSARCAHGD